MPQLSEAEVELRASQSFSSVEEAIEAFKLFARVEGRSPKTVETYNVAFGDLLEFTKGDIPLSDVTPGLIRRWIAHKLDQGYAKATVNIRLRAIRALFNWLHREGYIKDNPVERIRQLKAPRQYPYVLSEPQVTALLKAAQKGARLKGHAWTGQRNWTLILTLLDGMVRLSELRGLELGDVSLQARSIRVRHGKGDKERIVYMGRRLTRAMRDWLQVRGHHIGEERLFITRGGYGMDSRNVQRIIARLADKAGIEGVRCSPHTLRHTGATLFIRNGGDPFSLQRLLGHSDIQTTMIYVHMAGAALREAHAKASPVDRLLAGR